MRVDDWIEQASPDELRAMVKALSRRGVTDEAGHLLMNAEQVRRLRADSASLWMTLSPHGDRRAQAVTQQFIGDRMYSVSVTVSSLDGFPAFPNVLEFALRETGWDKPEGQSALGDAFDWFRSQNATEERFLVRTDGLTMSNDDHPRIPVLQCGYCGRHPATHGVCPYNAREFPDDEECDCCQECRDECRRDE